MCAKPTSPTAYVRLIRSTARSAGNDEAGSVPAYPCQLTAETHLCQVRLPAVCAGGIGLAGSSLFRSVLAGLPFRDRHCDMPSEGQS